MQDLFFGGGIVIENYVIGLKDLVGLEAFIDAVGIGKENDFTNHTENSMKSIYEILKEKDFSKITTFIEKLYILMGDFRISKTQASDIFWKLFGLLYLQKVGIQRSYMLVRIFIAYGIGEFSRKLVKGIHYFVLLKISLINLFHIRN